MLYRIVVTVQMKHEEVVQISRQIEIEEKELKSVKLKIEKTENETKLIQNRNKQRKEDLQKSFCEIEWMFLDIFSQNYRQHFDNDDLNAIEHIKQSASIGFCDQNVIRDEIFRNYKSLAMKLDEFEQAYLGRTPATSTSSDKPTEVK